MRRFSVLLGLAAFATFASATWMQSNGTHVVDQDGKTIQKFGCGAKADNAPTDFLKAMEKLHADDKHSGSHSALGSRAARKNLHKPGKKFKKQTAITIPTYFHVLQSTAKAGVITQAMASNQIAAMKKAYNPYGIDFTLVDTTFTTNDAWAIGNPADMDAAKAALRKGNYGTLNLYFHTDFAGGNLGTCTLPSQVPAGADPSIYVSDGCNVNANTMPGGTFTGYNAGGTTVHETGHWLGLLHTFEGNSCDGQGDYIDDTPMQSVQTNGCPASPPKDSCPGVAGADPINNYMDYSTDACYSEFSPLQVARMQAMWTAFRAAS